MTDLSQRVRAHLAQCHRNDESEHLLADLVDAFDRLKAENAATAEREDLERGHRNTLGAIATNAQLGAANARAALNGERGA